MLVVEPNSLGWLWVVEIWNIAFTSQDDVLFICWFLCSMLFQFVFPKKVWKLYTLELSMKSPCLWTCFHSPIPSFQCSPQSKEFLLNLSMKCWNSAFNAQGSRGFYSSCTRSSSRSSENICNSSGGAPGKREEERMKLSLSPNVLEKNYSLGPSYFAL